MVAALQNSLQLPTQPTDGGHLAALELARLARPEALEALREALAADLAHVRARFEAARLGGREAAHEVASVHDALLRQVWAYATQTLHPVANPTPSERAALFAVGGYGRGEMAPFSDIDLLFLVPAGKAVSASVEQRTEAVLYLLWDLGLKVGHSVRSGAQCARLARDDQTVLTSLLDARLLAGDATLAEMFAKRFAALVRKTPNRAYIAKKLGERDERHQRQGDSRYQLEPDVKCGKGGLRDLQALYWIALFLDFADGSLEEASQRYQELGLFDARAARRHDRAADFLWRTRFHLHYAAARAQDHLTFDLQTRIAPLMGHRPKGWRERPERAVESFMREYFTNAREVGALTRIACARLEAQNKLRLPAGLDRLVARPRRRLDHPDFVLNRGRLDFRDPLTIRERPVMMLELFQLAGARNLDIHPDALQSIDFRLNLIDTDFRRDTDASQVFQAILLDSAVPGATLRLMNEAGVLGRYLLEFGGIVARTQFNMHHAFTVDEHTLQLVTYLDDIEKGMLEEPHPVSSRIARGLSRPQRLTLYLACLLHDTGKGVGDQCVEGARLARRACRRLGIDREVTDDVAWLVRSHLLMSETAQRRDISDLGVIARFAETVGSQARLDMLTLLTVVDIRSVGPGIWNDWKGTLLRELYTRTLARLRGLDALPASARAESLREQLLDRLPTSVREAAEATVRDLPDSYWQRGDMEDFVRHARFFARNADSIREGEAVAHARIDRRRDITELWIHAPDRAGLFADLTLAIAASGAQVAGARLHSTTGQHTTGQHGAADAGGGRVFNIFFLQNADGLAFGRLDGGNSDRGRIAALLEATRRAARGEVEGLSAPTRLPSRRAAAIPVEARVSVLERGAGCVVEVSGRDRPGLLHAIAQVFVAHGLPLRSAHLESEGPRAVDTFYLAACPVGKSLGEELESVLAG